MLGGKTVIMADAMVRGDLTRTVSAAGSSGGAAPQSNTSIFIGRYCFLSRGCCLRPPGRIYKGSVPDHSSQHHPLANNPNPLLSLYLFLFTLLNY